MCIPGVQPKMHPLRGLCDGFGSALCHDAGGRRPALAGFFEWNAEPILRPLENANKLLPAINPYLRLYFPRSSVNDIVCLVLVPFVLAARRNYACPPLGAVLLAVATSSNIGRVATITGNPQNMLIVSFPIGYLIFCSHYSTGPQRGVTPTGSSCAG